ncbi:MaoC family dehydratase [Kineobactrum sediminis]|uniref:MaoC family dehydratase n=1 Tax=Kineobactrum sediminis TaxID=1905677 RepID=A0A2N5XZ87_9GAMM|nr:MaoC family dehydratase N-terminal domain-containing protein [Kineobactrum sediminis]PLW81454.1 MaoC family dehydratase [Kineobactrum sediminis]
MLDKAKIGHEFPSFVVDIEKGRLRFFAKSIGETNPIYTDESAAQAAGYRTIPAPPTFMFSVDLEGPELLPILKLFDLDMGRILHGSQEFEYLGQIYAGDRITQQSRIVDIFDKKGGALEFIVQESRYTNQNNELVGTAQQTLVYRN